MSDSVTQDRSPRSPGLSLADSISLTARLFEAIRTATVAPEIAVKPIGYGGLNGAAMTALATLAQYGLIDRSGGKVAVTPLAIRILHPKGDNQKDEAVREAALFPRVMKELFEGYLDCSEAVITGHLIQSGFNADRAKRVAAIHVANKEFAKLAPVILPQEIASDSDVIESEANADLTPGVQRLSSPQVGSRSFEPSVTNATKVLAQYTIPLGSNEATIVFMGQKLTTDDFDALIDFVEFSKRQFQRAEASKISMSKEVAQDFMAYHGSLPEGSVIE